MFSGEVNKTIVGTAGVSSMHVRRRLEERPDVLIDSHKKSRRHSLHAFAAAMHDLMLSLQLAYKVAIEQTL